MNLNTEKKEKIPQNIDEMMGHPSVQSIIEDTSTPVEEEKKEQEPRTISLDEARGLPPKNESLDEKYEKMKMSICDHIRKYGPKQKTQLAWELYVVTRLTDAGMGMWLDKLEKAGCVTMDKDGIWYVCESREG